MEWKMFKGIQDKVTGWGKKLICWQMLAVLTAGIIIFVGICFYQNLVIHYACLAVHWFFKYPEGTRNVIYLFAAVIGACLLYWRAKTADMNAEAAKQSAEIADKVLTAEQITRAIEQLAHKKPSVRLGGILSLEKIALAQKEERIKIAHIFVSFIRTRARRNSKEVKKDLKKSELSELKHIDDFKVYREQRLDVESAVRALANIASKVGKTGQFEEQYNEIKQHLCDLQNTDLRGLSLSSVDLSNFNLKAVDFSGANLIFTNFNRATLSFFYSDVTREEDIPKFIQASLMCANFSDTILSGIDFSHSFLIDAKFNNTSLSHTVFENCFISGTHFESSKNLTQEQIDKAYCSDDKPPIVPEGLKPPSSRTPSPPLFHN